MEVITLIISTLVITASGALSPGPLTVATLVISLHGEVKDGLEIALGHMLFEFPFVIMLTLAFDILNNYLKTKFLYYGLAFIMVIFMTYFSLSTLKEAFKPLNATTIKVTLGNPLLTGFLLTCLNPFFLIWWATIGIVVIEMSLHLGFTRGFMIMYASHIWLDFTWLGLVAYAGSKGKHLLGSQGYKIVMGFLSLLLLSFAVKILIETLILKFE